jgi:hypothetical protein
VWRRAGSSCIRFRSGGATRIDCIVSNHRLGSREPVVPQCLAEHSRAFRLPQGASSPGDAALSRPAVNGLCASRWICAACIAVLAVGVTDPPVLGAIALGVLAGALTLSRQAIVKHRIVDQEPAHSTHPNAIGSDVARARADDSTPAASGRNTKLTAA